MHKEIETVKQTIFKCRSDFRLPMSYYFRFNPQFRLFPIKFPYGRWITFISLINEVIIQYF